MHHLVTNIPNVGGAWLTNQTPGGRRKTMLKQQTRRQQQAGRTLPPPGHTQTHGQAKNMLLPASSIRWAAE